MHFYFHLKTFQPMANCAREVITQNGFSEVIKLIPKRSTDITVGINKDMEQKANVLITEVFDTELIGEGAIGTFNHAHKHLLMVHFFCISDFIHRKLQFISYFLGRIYCDTCKSYNLCPAN